MKFTLALIALSAPAAMGAPIVSCGQQAPCFDITVTKVDGGDCSGDCYFEICQTFNLGAPGCVKGNGSGGISHVCEKDDSTCSSPFSGYGGDVGADTGDTFCQKVPVGGQAEFVVKDGNERGDNCGSYATTLEGGLSLTCSGRNTFSEIRNTCTGGGNSDKECIWFVDAPLNCDGGGGAGGDPHIKLWNGERYSFHGECDLMMLHSEEFAGNTGLDLHLRTTIVDFYSYIESAALKIGSSILEVTSGQFFVDGEEKSDEDLPMVIGGYTLNEPEMIGNAKVYRVNLEKDDFILFRTYKQFISVDFAGNRDDFSKSTGLLGDFHTGAMIGRDGQVFDQPLDFGMNWQVQADEPKLFRDQNREPQLPRATCVMPAATSRHLKAEADPKLLAAAQGACSHKNTNDFEFCVFDVLATGDVGMAHAW